MNRGRRAFISGTAFAIVGAALGVRAITPVSGQATSEKIPFSDTATFVWNPEYSFNWANEGVYAILKELHPSPIAKYEHLYHWLKSEGVPESEFTASEPLTQDDFLRAHTKEYIDSLEKLANSYRGYGGLLNGENPIDPHILNFVKASCAGTYQAARIALEQGSGMNLSGGFHHAFPDHAEGFCHLNDVAIAIKKLQHEGLIRKAMIVDVDLHHGNGNAYTFYDDPLVSILDIYQEDNYPEQKVPIDFPIPLLSTEGIDNDRYLSELHAALPPALESFKPDIVFYLNGADPYQEDILGDFQLTIKGLEERDRFVLETTKAMGIPTAVVLAGGYARIMQDVVAVHGHCAKIIRE